MRVVVEGSGAWAMEYFRALAAHAGTDHTVFFTHDSTFGLDGHAERLHAQVFADYLQATLRNARTVRDAGFATLDVKDTLFKSRRNPARRIFPQDIDVVFVVTPDRTHCDIAERWLGCADRIFVEKPFDVSAERIRRFRARVTAQKRSRVFGVDHYFVRCNQAALDGDYFAEHLLGRTGRRGLRGDFTGFEFCLTEPPASRDGRYDITPVRERALALQGGMVFDLGAHAVPLLIPFFDLQRGIRLCDVWAGRCEELRDVIFSGAETFSIATVECCTRQTRTKPGTSLVSGRLIVGKDIGQRPQKYFTLKGPGGEVRFDLVSYRVDHTSPAGVVTPLAALYQGWTHFFVAEVLAGRTPRSVELYRPDGAERVIGFLEVWRDGCRLDAGGRPRTLSEHAAGVDVSVLRDRRYQVVQGGKKL